MSVVQPPTTTRSRQCHDVDEDEVRSTVFAMPYTSIYGRQFAHALPHQHRPAREERPGAAGEIQVLHVADHPNERVISVAPAGTHALVAERRSGFALMVDGTRTPLVVDRGGASTYVRSWVTVPRHCNGEPSLCWSSWGKSTPFTALPRCVNMGDDCAVTDARPFFGTNQSRDDLDAHGHMGGIEAVIDAECRLCLRGWMAEGPDGDALARALAGPACARPLPIVRHNGYQVFTGLAVHHVAVSARACFAVLRASGKVVAWGPAVKELPGVCTRDEVGGAAACCWLLTLGVLQRC